MEDVGDVENVAIDEESEDQNKDDAADDPRAAFNRLKEMALSTRRTTARRAVVMWRTSGASRTL